MLLTGLVITFSLLVIGMTVIINLIFFPRLQVGQLEDSPLVSVLIPARDEASVISLTVKQVLAQSYPNFELLLLDDGSNDDTANLATQAANGDERFHLLRGDPLPPGWLGKNWACHQLMKSAGGDLLLFLDADVRLQSTALASLVTYLIHQEVGLLTVWPTQITCSWGERLVVPLIGFAIMGYLPILPVHHTPWPAFAAANGQCMLFTRTAYQKSGGHAAVRNAVVEDVALARRVKAVPKTKQNQLKAAPKVNRIDQIRDYLSSPLRMTDGNRMICCQMYPKGWFQVRDGFSKNILGGHQNSVPFLLLSTIFHWLIFIVPWIWLLFGGGWWAFGLGVTGISLRASTAVFTHQRLIDALLMPLSVVLMTRIAFQSIIWHYSGTAIWKGRPVQIDD